MKQGFYADSGDAAFKGKAFSRESLLQAKGKWGEVAFGRAGGLSSDCRTYTNLHGSALWTSYYTDGNVAGVFVTSDRMDNMVIYKSRNLPTLPLPQCIPTVSAEMNRSGAITTITRVSV